MSKNIGRSGEEQFAAAAASQIVGGSAAVTARSGNKRERETEHAQAESRKRTDSKRRVDVQTQALTSGSSNAPQVSTTSRSSLNSSSGASYQEILAMHLAQQQRDSDQRNAIASQTGGSNNTGAVVFSRVEDSQQQVPPATQQRAQNELMMLLQLQQQAQQQAQQNQLAQGLGLLQEYNRLAAAAAGAGNLSQGIVPTSRQSLPPPSSDALQIQQLLAQQQQSQQHAQVPPPGIDAATALRAILQQGQSEGQHANPTFNTNLVPLLQQRLGSGRFPVQNSGSHGLQNSLLSNISDMQAGAAGSSNLLSTLMLQQYLGNAAPQPAPQGSSQMTAIANPNLVAMNTSFAQGNDNAMENTKISPQDQVHAHNNLLSAQQQTAFQGGRAYLTSLLSPVDHLTSAAKANNGPSPEEEKQQPSKSMSTSSHVTIPMACPTDRRHLSGYQVVIREQLEFFVSQKEDSDYSVQGRKKQTRVGQVGIRCRHCAHLPHRLRGRGAVYYPAKVSGVYQAAQNMASNHLNQYCSLIPLHIRQDLCKLRGTRSDLASAGGGKQYWADRCREIGLVEDDNGLHLKQEVSSSVSKK